MPIKKIMIALCFTLFSTALFAAPRTYNIQLIVFSRLTPQTLASQQWPLLAPSTVQYPAPKRPATALQGEANALRKNPEYQVLMTGAWTETWDSDGTITLPISNGSNLQGTVNITLGHYFDVHTNVLFTQPTSLLRKMDTTGYFNQISQSDFTFQLIQDRRMKSGELNYLGNAVVGVLIKILKA